MYTAFLSGIPEAVTYGKLPQEKISNTEKEFYSLFDVELPRDYIGLLRFTNGLSYNGKRIAGVYDSDFLKAHPRKKSMDIIRFNQSFRDLTDINDYILIGKSDIDLIVYNIRERNYQILSNGTMECFGTFDLFLDLLYDFFKAE